MRPFMLIFTEQQWLYNAELQMFAVTREDIKNAHGDGFMKYAHGVKLYLQKFLDGRDMKSNIMQILKEYHGCAENCKGCIDKTDRILQVIRENIPAEKVDVCSKRGVGVWFKDTEGWNSYRQSLLQALLGKDGI